MVVDLAVLANGGAQASHGGVATLWAEELAHVTRDTVCGAPTGWRGQAKAAQPCMTHANVLEARVTLEHPLFDARHSTALERHKRHADMHDDVLKSGTPQSNKLALEKEKGASSQ